MRALVTATLALVVLGAALKPAAIARPTGASAGCGGVERAGALRSHGGELSPLTIGDSTMLLSEPALAGDGFTVNARGCRQYPEALALLGELLQAHELPHLVVIALGANGEIENGEIERALQILGRERVLALLTPRELGGGSGADARLVRAEGRMHPGRVVVLDWVAYSSGHPDWFQPDGLHLTLGGAAAFARLIDRVGPLAALPGSLHPGYCGQASASAQPGRLAGVGMPAPGSVLHLRPESPAVELTVTNSGAAPVQGLATLRLLAGGDPIIAASCVVVPAQGAAPLTLQLERPALASIGLLGRYRVRLELALSGSEGASVTLAAGHLLTSAGRSTPGKGAPVH